MQAEAQIEESMSVDAQPHRSVLLREVVDLLDPAPDAVVVDATLGAGGHAEALLERLGPEGRLLGIDRDPVAMRLSGERLARFEDRFTPLPGRHEDIVEVLRDAGSFAVDGIVADLGVSSMQLDAAERGFSFLRDGPLDMRMGPDADTTAEQLLADAPVEELVRILREYGEEKLAVPIARAIVRRREQEPIRRTADLAALVEQTAGPRARRYRIHPATRTFQAIRIAVNGELDGLERFVRDACSMLRKGGRLAVISFHSLEDRIVKHSMRDLANRCVCPPALPVCGCGRENFVARVTRKAVRPDEVEMDANPRSRSARLRVVERI